MRKIIAASTIGLALVAGQAIAANGSAQTLRVGDRVGAALGEREDQLPGAFTLFGGGTFGTVATITVSILALEAIGVIDVVDGFGNDDDESPSS